MNLQITKNGTDITNYLISYERIQSLCSGIGSLNLTLEAVNSLSLKAWDEIILYEDGNKKGTYYIDSITNSLNDATKILGCQDASKKLSDTFLETSEVIGNNNYAKYWITYLLNSAGVTYNFTDAGNGAILNPEGYIGLDSAYNLMIPLLQQSGWYMYFNANGKAIIGKLTVDLEKEDFTLLNKDILSIYSAKDDKMLRNRAVVWGTQDYATGLDVFADITTHTPWNYDNKDIRAIVYANSAIPDTGTAYGIANKMLNEFARITFTHLIEMPGFYELGIGDVVNVDTDLASLPGLITSIRSAGSADGFRTYITLDERCPRLFSYIGNDNEYVYISTMGSGVKRKLLDGYTWFDYSAGLLDFNIIDLMIKRRIFACVSDAGDGYIRTPVTSVWSKYTPPSVTSRDGIVYTASQIKAVSCDINAINYNIVFGYRTIDPDENGQYRSWLVEITNKKGLVGAYPINLSVNEGDFRVIDNEILGETKLAVAAGPLKYILDNNPEVFWGIKDTTQVKHTDWDAHTYGPLASDEVYEHGFDSTNYSNYSTLNSVYIKGQDLYLLGSPFGWVKPFFKNVCVNKDESTEIYTAYPRWPEITNVYDRYLWIDPESADEETENPYNILYFSKNGFGDYFVSNYKIKPLLNKNLEEGCANILPIVKYATTENITLSGTLNIDGAILPDPITTFRVLVKDQDDPKENGIYLPKPGLWERVTTDLQKHSIVSVASGESNYRKTFQVSSDTPVYGNDDIIFEEVLNVLETVSEDKMVISHTDFLDYVARNVIGVLGEDGYIYWSVRGQTAPDYFEHKIVSYSIRDGSLNTSNLFSFLRAEYTDPAFLFTNAGRGAGYVALAVGKRIGTSGKSTLFTTLLEDGVIANNVETILDAFSDPNLVEYGKWGQPYVVETGYLKVGNYTKTFIKFQYRHFRTLIKPECQAVCPTVPGFDRREFLSAGGFELTSMRETVGRNVTFKGFADQPVVGPCCSTRVYFDYLDYEEFNFGYAYYEWFPVHYNTPLTSSISPVFIHLGKDIYSSETLNKIGTLENPAGYGQPSRLIMQMDDFDNGIYSVNTSTKLMTKERTAGGILAQVDMSDCELTRSLSQADNFINGYYIATAFPDESEVPKPESINYIYKMKNSIIMSGVNLAYLMELTPSGTYKIRDYEFNEFKLEESYDYPLVSFTQPSSVAYYLYSGEVITFSGGDHYRIYQDWYNKLQVNEAVKDVTITNLVGYSGVDFGRYVITSPTSGEYLHILKTEDVFLQDIPELSGYFGQVESTNYKEPNYIFTNTISGVQQFYQRNTLSGNFINASINLPTDSITSIRADDII